VSLAFLRLFYFVQLGALAGVVPFLGGRLESSGIDGALLGVMMGAAPAARILLAPAWAWVADRTRRAGLLLRVACGLSFVATIALMMSTSYGWMLAAMVLYSAARSPTGPIVDGMVLDALRERGHGIAAYGTVRLWGSVGFAVVAAGAGWLSTHGGTDPLVVGAALAAVAFALTFAFPSRGEGGPAPVGPALRALANQPGFFTFLAAASLLALTMSVYDSFFSVHVRALGLGNDVVAGAVAVGVTCEIAAMSLARRVLARLGPARMLMVATAVAVPRWALVAWLRDPVALVAVQALHGVTFAFFWIAAVQWMAQRAPKEVSASAQSLLSASSYGLGALVGALLAGMLRRELGSAAIFGGMSVIAAVAAVFAVRLLIVERAGERKERAAG
jgi:MFS family permease